MGWLYGLIGVIAVYAAHRLSCWAEDRGWIYYRKGGRPGMSASAFLEIQSMMEPSKKHVLHVMREEDDEQDDAGGPPKP